MMGVHCDLRVAQKAYFTVYHGGFPAHSSSSEGLCQTGHAKGLSVQPKVQCAVCLIWCSSVLDSQHRQTSQSPQISVSRTTSIHLHRLSPQNPSTTPSCYSSKLRLSHLHQDSRTASGHSDHVHQPAKHSLENMAGLPISTTKRMLMSGDFADFYILCGDREIEVHRTIVCAQSCLFQKVCDGSLLVCEDITRHGASLTRNHRVNQPLASKY